jgi:hypothetical protein
MINTKKNVSVSGTVTLLLIFLNAFILKVAYIQSEKWYMAFVITLPLLIVAVMFDRHKKQADKTNPEINEKMIDEQNIKSIEQIYEQGSNKITREIYKF